MLNPVLKKINLKGFLFLFISFCYWQLSFAQNKTSFAINIGKSKTDNINCINRTADGNYIAGGASNTALSNIRAIIFLK